MEDASFITNWKKNWFADLTTSLQKITSETQSTTAYQANLFLTGIHLFMVTGMEWSAFPSADHCQSQMQTPHSVCVVHTR